LISLEPELFQNLFVSPTFSSNRAKAGHAYSGVRQRFVFLQSYFQYTLIDDIGHLCRITLLVL